MRSADIVIIGGGVVGASVAYHLGKRGAGRILVLDRAARQGTGSTGAATGGIRAQFGSEINIKLSLYSLEFFQNCEFDPEYEPKGYLFFATNEGEFTALRKTLDNQRRLGVSVEIVDAASIAEIAPGLHCDDIVGGSFGRHDGFVNPLAIMHGFTEASIRSGAHIEFGIDVTAIVTDSGRVRGVETSAGVFECGSVVLCTGALAAQLAATAGIDLPVQPQRRQIVWAETRQPLPPELPMVIDIGSGFHFRPARDFHRPTVGRPSREVLFAYADLNERASSSTVFDDSSVDRVCVMAERRASFLRDAEVIHGRCRAGLYENTPDHHAILGGCEVEGLYFASGFSGHGVMHSPAAGRALSEIILDGRSNFLDVSCLSLDRFSKGELIEETAFI